MHSPTPTSQQKVIVLCLVMMMVTLWLLMRGYQGLTGDAQIYAFQALARMRPQFAADLYLQNTSQDQFTIFSAIYAWFIGLVGLEDAARLLTLLFTFWLLTATWSFACAIAGRDAAWLAVAFLLIVAGGYGGSDVFRVSEQYLTARMPAEALIATALACHVRDLKRTALLLAIGALFVHPLMALPGLLLLICMSLPNRANVVGAIGGLVAALGIAAAATTIPAASHLIAIVDPTWLAIVRERSQFLFLQLWTVHDWDANTRPFLYLGFTAIAIQDASARKLCFAASLVGATGLAVAWIAGLVGPVALLLQGQAWRWVWITVLVSAVLLPHTVLQVWRDEKCGPLCGILLISGWTLSAVDGTACVTLALFLWLARTSVAPRMATYFRWITIALGTAIGAWILFKSWSIVSSPTSVGRIWFGPPQIRDIFGLRIPAISLTALLLWRTTSSRTPWIPALLCTALIGFSIFIFPAAFKQPRTLAAALDISEFEDWANAVPPTSTVLVSPARDVGAFVWFTLERPNYLAVDQSAGVVFSRATALEVRRRSEVLLPLMDPNWKILTSLSSSAANPHKDRATNRPLTARSLIQVCSDIQLGFVIAPQNVGFDPIRHEHAGAWKDWNLYDCRKIRSPVRPL